MQSLFFIARQALVLNVAGWKTISVAAAVPAGTTGAILHVWNTAAVDYTVRVRCNGAAHSGSILLYRLSQRYLFVKLDASRQFEMYCSAAVASVVVQLIGFTHLGVTMLTEPLGCNGARALVSYNEIPSPNGSNNMPRGTAAASGFITYNASCGFRDPDPPWRSNATPCWLSYDFGAQVGDVTPVSYMVGCWTSITASPRDWTLDGWNGVGWDVIDTQVAQVFAASERKTYALAGAGSYQKFRINITANNGANPYCRLNVYHQFVPATGVAVIIETTTPPAFGSRSVLPYGSGDGTQSYRNAQHSLVPMTDVDTIKQRILTSDWTSGNDRISLLGWVDGGITKWANGLLRTPGAGWTDFDESAVIDAGSIGVFGYMIGSNHEVAVRADGDAEDNYRQVMNGQSTFLTKVSSVYIWEARRNGFPTLRLQGAIDGATAPALTTDAASDVAPDGATLNGTVTDDGGCNTLERGFDYGEVMGGPYPNSVSEEGNWAAGAFALPAPDLDGATTYYFRAYAINMAGLIGYGTEETFDTLAVVAPTVVTLPASPIGKTSAQLNGEITSRGGENCSERGFEYGKVSGGPYPNTINEVVGGYGLGLFDLTPVGLDTGDTYYFVAYAVNTAGTGTGAEESFVPRVKPSGANLPHRMLGAGAI